MRRGAAALNASSADPHPRDEPAISRRPGGCGVPYLAQPTSFGVLLDAAVLPGADGRLHQDILIWGEGGASGSIPEPQRYGQGFDDCAVPGIHRYTLFPPFSAGAPPTGSFCRAQNVAAKPAGPTRLARRASPKKKSAASPDSAPVHSAGEIRALKRPPDTTAPGLALTDPVACMSRYGLGRRFRRPRTFFTLQVKQGCGGGLAYLIQGSLEVQPHVSRGSNAGRAVWGLHPGLEIGAMRGGFCRSQNRLSARGEPSRGGPAWPKALWSSAGTYCGLAFRRTLSAFRPERIISITSAWLPRDGRCRWPRAGTDSEDLGGGRKFREDRVPPFSNKVYRDPRLDGHEVFCSRRKRSRRSVRHRAGDAAQICFPLRAEPAGDADFQTRAGRGWGVRSRKQRKRRPDLPETPSRPGNGRIILGLGRRRAAGRRPPGWIDCASRALSRDSQRRGQRGPAGGRDCFADKELGLNRLRESGLVVQTISAAKPSVDAPIAAVVIQGSGRAAGGALRPCSGRRERPGDHETSRAESGLPAKHRIAPAPAALAKNSDFSLEKFCC